MLNLYIGILRFFAIILLIAGGFSFLASSNFGEFAVFGFVATLICAIAIFAFCEFLQLIYKIEGNTKHTELNTALLVKFHLKENPALEAIVAEYESKVDSTNDDLNERVVCPKCKSTNLKTNKNCYSCKTKLS